MNLYVIILSFISGVLGAMGFGGGSVLIVLLTNFMLFDQKKAQGINLIFFIITCTPSILINIHKGLTDTKLLKEFLRWALPGVVLGLLILPAIEAKLLSKIFGGALLLLGIKNLFEKTAKAPPDQ